MNVLIRGPLLSVSGYGVHARLVFEWAIKQPGWNVSCAIVPWGICTYYIDPDALGGMIGKIMERSAPANIKSDISLQIQLPDEWDDELARINIGVTAGVETDRCSEQWVKACLKMTKVIVPSEFTRRTFIDSGVPAEHIIAIPEAHSYTDEISSHLDQQLTALPTDFNLLLFGQITGNNPENDRKNTFYTIKWLCELFKDDPSVGVIVKTNMGRFTTSDRQFSQEMFERLIGEVRTGEYPRFYLAHGMLDEIEISTVYKNKNIKALVAPTRGEGWGLPLLDAATCGLPVITTGYSGHMDFMKYVKFLSIDHEMVDVHPSRIDGRVFIPGARWANPKQESFNTRLTKFRKASDLPTQWAEKAAPLLREKFSLNTIMQQYNTLLGDIIDNS